MGKLRKCSYGNTRREERTAHPAFTELTGAQQVAITILQAAAQTHIRRHFKVDPSTHCYINPVNVTKLLQNCCSDVTNVLFYYIIMSLTFPYFISPFH